MFWVGKGAVKTTTVYLKCGNTFVEDCMFPRLGLNQVFFLVKKMGDKEIRCLVWFGFNASIYLHCYYLFVALTRAISGFFVYKVIVIEDKIK